MGMSLFPEIEKTFVRLEGYLGAQGCKEFKQSSFADLYQYHFGLGMYIRNHFLGEKHKLYQLFAKAGAAERDEISFLLIQLFWVYLRLK
jgi:hypothetical protein